MAGTPEKVRRIPLTDIKVVDRLRPVDEDWAKFLAGSIAKDGLLQPIGLCREGKGYRLSYGAHRLRAVEILGWSELQPDNYVIHDHEALGRRAREIAENVMRRELDPLDRAAFVAELYEIELQRAGVSLGEHKSKVGGLAFAARMKAEASEAGAMFAPAYNLQDQVAEKVGLSVRTIKNELALHRGLKPATIAKLRGHKVAQAASQLLALAKLPEDQQIAAAEAIVSGEASNAAFAVRIITCGREPPKSEKKAHTIIASFDALESRWKAETLRLLAKLKLPKGFRIVTPEDAA